MASKKLKILYITQKVDFNDDILGTVHSWIANFSTKVEKLYVSCLYLGLNKLPENCQVSSLGKEKGENNFKYIINFYKQVIPLIFKKRINGIFVHMNQQYIYLLLPLWPVLKLLGIPIVWWKSHGSLRRSVYLTRHFVDRIVTTADAAFPVKTKKKRVIGHGIDTSLFKPDDKEKKCEFVNIVSVGRLSPVKRYELLLKAIKKVKEDLPKIKLRVNIYGQLAFSSQKKYADSLINLNEKLGLKDVIIFNTAVPNIKMPEIYNQADLVINSGGSNSLDKTSVEAMACGKISIDSNLAFKESLQKSDLTDDEKELLVFKRNDYLDLAKKIMQVINLNNDKKTSMEKKLRQLAVKYHDVDHLNEQIIEIFNNIL